MLLLDLSLGPSSTPSSPPPHLFTPVSRSIFLFLSLSLSVYHSFSYFLPLTSLLLLVSSCVYLSFLILFFHAESYFSVSSIRFFIYLFLPLEISQLSSIFCLYHFFLPFYLVPSFLRGFIVAFKNDKLPNCLMGSLC